MPPSAGGQLVSAIGQRQGGHATTHASPVPLVSIACHRPTEEVVVVPAVVLETAPAAMLLTVAAADVTAIKCGTSANGLQPWTLATPTMPPRLAHALPCPIIAPPPTWSGPTRHTMMKTAPLCSSFTPRYGHVVVVVVAYPPREVPPSLTISGCCAPPTPSHR